MDLGTFSLLKPYNGILSCQAVAGLRVVITVQSAAAISHTHTHTHTHATHSRFSLGSNSDSGADEIRSPPIILPPQFLLPPNPKQAHVPGELHNTVYSQS